MKLKFLNELDFVNYKKPSMFIGAPSCTFKCGRMNCQNSSLANEPIITIPTKQIIDKYRQNKMSEAIVFGGLEPFDNWNELLEFIKLLRREYFIRDDVVIYTGYNKDEIDPRKIELLTNLGNIIIKWGRYVPNEEPHFDEILGINLISSNQYAEKLI
jgi:hypothetical protein